MRQKNPRRCYRKAFLLRLRRTNAGWFKPLSTHGGVRLTDCNGVIEVIEKLERRRGEAPRYYYRRLPPLLHYSSSLLFSFPLLLLLLNFINCIIAGRSKPNLNRIVVIGNTIVSDYRAATLGATRKKTTKPCSNLRLL